MLQAAKALDHVERSLRSSHISQPPILFEIGDSDEMHNVLGNARPSACRAECTCSVGATGSWLLSAIDLFLLIGLWEEFASQPP